MRLGGSATAEYSTLEYRKITKFSGMEKLKILRYSDASCRVLPVNPKPLCKIGLQNILNRIKSPNQMPPHRIRRRENSSLIPFKSFLPFRLEPQILKTIENAPRTPTRLLMQE